MRSFNTWAIAAAISVSLAGGTAFAQSGGGSGAASGAGQSGAGQAGTSGAGSGSGQSGAGQAGGMTGDIGSGSSQADRGQGNLQKFAEQVAISNMAEIQLGQLAQQKAQDPEVKQFAQMMVDQHTQAQNQLQQAASTSGISLPTSLDSKHQKIQDKLSSLSGADFDKEYMKVMVASHKDTQKLLEKRVGKSSNNAGAAGTSGSGSGATEGTSGSGSGMGTSGSGTGSGTTAGTSGAGSSGVTGGTTTGTGGQAGTTAASGTGQQGGTAGTVGTSGSAITIDSWAQTVLPQVQQHLQEAKDLEKRVKDEGKNGGKNDK